MLGPMPAYGLYARNSRALTFQNVRFQVSSADLRPALILDRVTDVAINGFSIDGNREAEACLRLIDSKEVYVAAARVLTPASVFLRLEGAGNSGIILDGGDLSKVSSRVELKNGALANSYKET